MDEDAFTKGLRALLKQGKDVAVGPGDDCAVLDFGLEELLLAAADQVVAGIHFLADKTSPDAVARKLLKRNLSDIAAMGGRPTHALTTIAMSPLDESWLGRFFEGLQDEAEKAGVSIVGGDISALPSPGCCCSLSILGKVSREALCLRSQAKPGDALFCTGAFGRSFPSGWHLEFKPRLEEGRFLAGAFSKAMMDVSDGLLKDACRMAEASGCALEIEPERIPARAGASVEEALSDGEDYELILALPPQKEQELLKRWPFKLAITRIGRFIEGMPGEARRVGGGELLKGEKGFDHFNGHGNHIAQ